MMSSSSSSTILASHHLANLIQILREANARYHYIAAYLRPAIQFSATHHARRQAGKLGLTIDIEKADNCPQSAVAAIPLPLLDRGTPSPSSPERALPSIRRPNLAIRVPAIPPPSPGPGSPLSSSGLLIPTLPAIPVLPSPWSAAERDSDPLVIRIPALAERMSSRAAEERVPSAPLMRYRALPDAPTDDFEDDWGVYAMEGVSPMSSNDTSSSYGSPATPGDNTVVMSQAKRKSAASGDTEKRTKYLRKSWNDEPASELFRTTRYCD